MSAVYGSLTINHILSKANNVAAQDMIGVPRVGVPPTTQMRNGHIGAALTQVVGGPPRSQTIAMNGTPCLGLSGANNYWHEADGTWKAAAP